MPFLPAIARHAWVNTALSLAACFGLYLLFTGDAGWRELLADVLATLATLIATLAFVRCSHFDIRLRWVDALQAWRLPWNAVIGTGEVLAALAQHVAGSRNAAGRLAAVPFEMGPPGDPEAAGRRALAVAYTSATPNSIVLGIVDAQRLMLFHQIVPTELRPLTRKLGARP